VAIEETGQLLIEIKSEYLMNYTVVLHAWVEYDYANSGNHSPKSFLGIGKGTEI
jgi:hypothetical protein